MDFRKVLLTGVGMASIGVWVFFQTQPALGQTAVAGADTLEFLIEDDAELMEDWKGKPREHSTEVGAMTGLGVYDGAVGASLFVGGSEKILHDGLIDGVNDQFFGEIYLGSVFLSEGSVFQYALQGRWDFHRNDTWSVYAMGGLGGTITGKSLDDSWRLAPRFGVGTFYELNPKVKLRAEVSHDLMILGAAYRL